MHNYIILSTKWINNVVNILIKYTAIKKKEDNIFMQFNEFIYIYVKICLCQFVILFEL